MGSSARWFESVWWFDEQRYAKVGARCGSDDQMTTGVDVWPPLDAIQRRISDSRMNAIQAKTKTTKRICLVLFFRSAFISVNPRLDQFLACALHMVGFVMLTANPKGELK
jgi:hypothetical protein